MLSLSRKYSQKVVQKVIVSGIQPTGVLHLGNYLGFVKNFENPEAKKYLFVADLHSNSVKPFHANLVASLIACGVDPEKTLLFYQSQVPEHAEFAWHLGSLVNVNKLAKLPQFKEKSNEYVSLTLYEVFSSFDGCTPNLLTYPVLQAADILIYKCTEVPVGEDQMHHVNMTLHLVDRIKEVFKKQIFPIPKVVLTKTPRIKSLSNPTKKMSKSDPNHHATLFLNDSNDVLLKKIKRSLTDSTGRSPEYDVANRPGVGNLVGILRKSRFFQIEILAALKDQPVETICTEVKDLSTLQLKLLVHEIVSSTFLPINEKVTQLLADKSYLDRLLVENGHIAREKASATLREFKGLAGYDQPSFRL